MTNYNERLDKILGSMQVEEYGTVSKADTKQAITSLIKELVAEAIKKPHILPKNAQHLESVKQGINFYHRQMRKRVDKLKEQL